MSRLLAVCLLLAAAVPFCSCQKISDGTEDGSRLPLFTFEEGVELTKLPLHKVLHPGRLVNEIAISMTAGTVEGPTNRREQLISYTGPLLLDHATGRVAPVAPTMRLRGGDTFAIDFYNNLTYPKGTKFDPHHGLNGFHDPFATNLHTHGLHDPTGFYAQTTPGPYEEGDNFFVVLPGKESASNAPHHLRFNSYIDKDHAPGLYWHHPHAHGSATLQLPTANGMMVVEDDPAWLPDEKGCAEIRGLLERSPDYIIHLMMFNFASYTPQYKKDSEYDAFMDDTNIQFYSETADPKNPLCCGNRKNKVLELPGQENAQHSKGLSGSGRDKDFALVNGGWKPVIPMKAGRYQRWRMIHAGFKRFFDMWFIDPVTKERTDRCEMLLHAKDGIFLSEVPRQVDHIYLTSGNRGELLIKCSGEPGDEFILTTGAPGSTFGPSMYNTSGDIFVQEVLATIRLTERTGPADPTPKLRACTPRRGAYFADLRDEALAAHGAQSKLVKPFGYPIGFMGNDHYGCSIAGEYFSFPDPRPFDLPLGSVVHYDWLHVRVHPLHLHTNPFQIVGLDDIYLQPQSYWTSWFEVGDYHDTLQLPQTVGTGMVSIRVQPGEFPGYAVVHCHFLQHEDQGCMKMVRFSCPGQEDPQPRECPKTAWRWAVPGDFPGGATQKYAPNKEF